LWHHHGQLLISSAEVQEAIKALTEVYGPDGIEKCDLLVGNLAEKKIPGFAISETSFMLFLLMAARRVEADRFLTEDFTDDVYTRTGMSWIKSTHGLRDVVRRHFPSIEGQLPPGESAFTPHEKMP
jgi:alpha-dioxygenase